MRILVAGAVVALALAGPAHVSEAAAPLAAFGQLPSFDQVELSPDGRLLAAIVGTGDDSTMVVREVDTARVVATSRVGTIKLRGLDWVGNNDLVATTSTTATALGLSNTRSEWSQLLHFHLKQGRWVPLLAGLPKVLNVVTGRVTGRMVEGKPVLVATGASLVDGDYVTTLFRINLENGFTRPMQVGTPETREFLLDRDGTPVARVDFFEGSREWVLLGHPGGSWKRIYSEVAPIDEPALLSLGNDAAHVLVNTPRSGTWETYEVALADGKFSPPLEYGGDLAFITDRATRLLAATRVTRLEDVEYRFLAPADQTLWQNVKKAFPGETVTLASWSDDRSRIVVEVEGTTNGDAYFLLDRRTGEAKFLANRYLDIEPGDGGTRTGMTYKAGDGRQIPAYLTLPPGITAAAAKRLPLVVLAHGGPAARDRPGFDWWAQALASRGYAVLQPQFRGSEGFGMAHLEAGYGQWGRLMQTDLSDGVRALAAAGTVDPARVCIVGGSYGGYAALAGATIDQGVYRCASSVAGVADLRQMLKSEVRDSGGTDNSTLRYWKRFMGAARPDDPALDALSPARLAGRVKIPVQLIHGKDDTVVLFEQSRLMENALKAAGAPVDMVTLDGEDHWLSRSATRLRMLTAMVGFLEKHNPPDGKVAAQ